MAGLTRLLVVCAAALAFPATAFAGALTLHPSGFGPMSYSAWKAHQGLPDSNGNDDQALYFQKLVPTATVAAGVAVIKGLEGTPASALTGLSWDHRTDGHCGAGAPRWNVNLTLADGSPETVFLGCFAAQHQTIAPNWCRDSYSTLPAFPAGATLRNIAIVFDAGTDNPMPQPPGCPVAAPAAGFVYLDNVTVELNGVPHTWTGASDNGNGQTIVQSSDPLEQLLDAPLATLFP